jgi:hypothetical protein
MIITDEFVMLAFPKTGSSFVRKSLKRLHKYNTLPNRVLRRLHLPTNTSMTELILPVIDQKKPPYPYSRHVTYLQIPEEHRHKVVASCIRNPFERYVSVYQFGQWKKTFHNYSEQLTREFPQFPDLSFDEYYRMIHIFARDNRLDEISPKIDLGVYTIQFIQFHFKNPRRTLQEIDSDYIAQRKYVDDMADIVFLHQENLNQELYEFLSGCGYPREDIEFLLEAERVNVTHRENTQRKLENFYAPELVETVIRRDRLIFDLFPEYRHNPGLDWQV